MPVVSVLTVFAYQNIVLMLKILYSHKAGNRLQAMSTRKLWYAHAVSSTKNCFAFDQRGCPSVYVGC